MQRLSMTTFLLPLACTVFGQASDDLVQKLVAGKPVWQTIENETGNLSNGQMDQLLRAAWPKMSLKRKNELVVYFSRSSRFGLMPSLDLGLHDGDTEVVSTCLETLMREMANPSSYDFRAAQAWCRANAGKSRQEAMTGLAAEAYRRLGKQSGRDLDWSVSFYSHSMGMREFAKMWTDDQRDTIYQRLSAEEAKRQVDPTGLQDFDDLMDTVGVSERYAKANLVPGWYNRKNEEQALRVLYSMKSPWTNDVMLGMLRYACEHPERMLRSMTYFELYYQNIHDPRVVGPLINILDTAPLTVTHAICSRLLPQVTSVTWEGDTNAAWWKAWYAENREVVDSATLALEPTQEQLRASNQLMMKLTKSPPEALSDGWSKLVPLSKQSLLTNIQSQKLANQLPFLELAFADADLGVRGRALTSLSQQSLTSFVSSTEALAWARDHKDLSRADLNALVMKSFFDALVKSNPQDALHKADALLSSIYGRSIPESIDLQTRNEVFQKLWKAALESDQPLTTVYDFIAKLGADSTVVRDEILPVLANPKDSDKYSKAVMILTRQSSDWAKDAILDQFQKLAAAPDGPISEHISLLTPSTNDRKDDRLIPEFIRLIILGPDGWKYWLDYFGLSPLTGIPYDALHTRQWWRDWWTQHAKDYPALKDFPMPEVTVQSTSVAEKADPEMSFEEVAKLFVESASNGEFLDAKKREKLCNTLNRADRIRAIPYLVAAIRAYGDSMKYDIGYFAICMPNHIDYFGAQDARWWVEWWEKNWMRFPSASSVLPDIRLKAGEPAKPAKVPATVAQAVHPVRSIEIGDTDFSDLESIRHAIGDAQIVQLGEPSHQDGATFLAKARLIRYLHEKCGFDVLVWESGMYDCDQMNQTLADGRSWTEAIDQGIFPIWGKTPPVRQLFEYAASTWKTKNPLQMSGADPQFSGQASNGFETSVAKFFSDAGMPLATDLRNALSIACGYTSLNSDGGTASESKQIFDSLSKIITENRVAIEAKVGATKTERMIRYLGNAAILATIKGNTSGVDSNNPRDRRMGENLVWLANGPYKNRKIIVWAASFHLMRNPSQIDTQLPTLSYKNLRDMGDWAHEALGKRMYTIAFVAHHGWIGNPFFGDQALDTASDDSIEGWLHNVGHPYAFVDFHALPATSPFHNQQIAGPLGYSPMKAVWPDIFDGFFFTDWMFSSSGLEIPLPARPRGKG
ncbi:MAG: erythromycin esterase family protein [Armatimonadetes bacterium]|nr:erythromycin esterase family protein [Armatimonadota bacterium]